MNKDIFAERARNKSMGKKFQDPAGIWTQDLRNTNQTLYHWAI